MPSKDVDRTTNRSNVDQMAPQTASLGAVYSGSALFASRAWLSEKVRRKMVDVGTSTLLLEYLHMKSIQYAVS